MINGARAHNSVYVIGGRDSGGGPLGTVERATLDANGGLGPFQGAVDGLVTPRYGHRLVDIGDHVYAIGGDNGVALTSIERATIQPNGTLGAFATVSGTPLGAGR